MRKLDKAKLETNYEPRTSAFSYGPKIIEPEKLHKEGKLEGQKLQETALATDQKVQLSVADEGRHSAL